jgi:FixJ family two-component response regulator
VDLRMAGKTGLDLVHVLRARGVAIPVIMITGHGEVSMAEFAEAAGAMEFLTKPVDGDLLVEAIARAIAGNDGHLPPR